MGERTILHVDMNAFYASVETLSHPEAAGRPMAVCGDAEKRRGVILAKNELAKAAGVKTGEAVWQAQKKCPGLLLLPPHHDVYRAFSRKANSLYSRFTDRVEPVSIDESFLDVTGSMALYGSGREMADAIRAAVKGELGLTVSVGVSFCKLFAKMGSDYKKPDATTVITRENFRALLYPLPVGDLISVGRVTARRLQEIGVRTIGDLARLEEPVLRAKFGKHGAMLFRAVRGLDDGPVRRPDEQEKAKSVGNGMTFAHNLTTLEEVHAAVMRLCESVGARLRRTGEKCRGVQVTIKDPQFRVIDRQQQLERPTNVTQELYRAALQIIERNWAVGAEKPIRLITVTAINLAEAGEEQLCLFADPKREKLEQVRDRLNEKFGKGAVKPASLLQNYEIK